MVSQVFVILRFYCFNTIFFSFSTNFWCSKCWCPGNDPVFEKIQLQRKNLEKFFKVKEIHVVIQGHCLVRGIADVTNFAFFYGSLRFKRSLAWYPSLRAELAYFLSRNISKDLMSRKIMLFLITFFVFLFCSCLIFLSRDCQRCIN